MIPPAGGDAPRCARCGALVGPDAEWCGQCFTPLGATAETAVAPVEAARPASAPAPTPGRSEFPPAARSTLEPEAATPAPGWPCAVCGAANPLNLDACSVCGASFASMMRSSQEPAPADPATAARASFLYPGLGHRLIGHPMDGLARGVLFSFLLVVVLLVVVSGALSGVGLIIAMLAGGLAVVVYVLTAREAASMARGGPPVASARAVLWVTVALILASMALLTLSVITVAGR